MGEIKSCDIENEPRNDGDYDDHQPEQKNVADEDVLKFMDSLHSYLNLVDSLSSSLRQGWFDFASARHSMGASRVNSVLLDLKEHSAATHLEVADGDAPHFTLCKWVSNDNADLKKMKGGDDKLQQKFNSMHLQSKDSPQPTVCYSIGREKRRRWNEREVGVSLHATVELPTLLGFEEAEEDRLQGGSSDSVDDQVQKERSKSLAIFGTLVSPKLRAAQSSFETALEKLVEIANVRASMLHAFEQVQERIRGIED